MNNDMNELMNKIREFAIERDWLQFNTPENLAKSISIESGELLECFQWNSNYNKKELEEEIADVLNYSLLLCSQIGADPKEILLNKIAINEKKYPVEKCNKNTDSASKINDYQALKSEFRNNKKKEDKI